MLLCVFVTPLTDELLFLDGLSSAARQENDENAQEHQAAVHGEKETALGRKWQAKQRRNDPLKLSPLRSVAVFSQRISKPATRFGIIGLNLKRLPIMSNRIGRSPLL